MEIIFLSDFSPKNRSILNDFHTTFSQKVMGYGFLESQESLSSLDDKTHPKNRVPPKNIITVLRRNENFQVIFFFSFLKIIFLFYFYHRFLMFLSLLLSERKLHELKREESLFL